MKKIKGGIIAAGLGERFQRKGIAVPKAMIEISGKPLIGYTMDHFLSAGITDVTVIFNTRGCAPCSEYVKRNYPDTHMEIICKDTRSSFESFCEVVSRAGDGHILVTTVDSIFQDTMMEAFIRFSNTVPDESIVLGMTDHVDDEKPLYIRVDEGGRVVSLGGENSQYVTCGVYFLHPRSLNRAGDSGYPSLRFFLKAAIDAGIPAFGFSMGKTFDVDLPEDIDKAQQWLTTQVSVLNRNSNQRLSLIRKLKDKSSGATQNNCNTLCRDG